MSNNVYLKGTEVLAELKAAFTAFDEQASNAMTRIESEIDQTRAWLIERKQFWQKEVETAEQDLATAESNLRACEASGYYDEEGDYVEPDCTCESDAVTDAQGKLVDVTAKLDNVTEWDQRIECGLAEFHRSAGVFGSVVTQQAQERQRFLDVKMRQYDAAAAISNRAELVSAQRTHRDQNQCAISERVAQIDITGDTDEKRILREAFLKLGGVSIGGRLIDTLVELGTQVGFAKPDELERRNCFAIFDKTTNRITLCHSLLARAIEVIAPHLAHEATHALWYRPSSIDQEYQAFKAQAEVWSMLKNGCDDEQNDEVQRMVDWGEHEFKEELRGWDSYSEYPESA